MADIDETILEDLEPTENDEDDESLAEDDQAEFLPFLPGGSMFPFPFGNGGRNRQPQTAKNRNYFSNRMTPFVTTQHFNSTLAKVRQDVARNATGIKQVNARVTVEQNVNRQQSTALAKQSKVNKHQTKQLAVLKRDLQKTKDMSLMMLLLNKPKSTEATTAEDTVGGQNIPTGSRVLYESGDSNSLLLPLLLMGGLGSDGGGSDNNMMLMALVLMDKL